MLRETITDLSNKLDPRQFVRIHRSSIVNLDRDTRNLPGKATATVPSYSWMARSCAMSKIGRQKLAELGKGIVAFDEESH